MLCNHRSDQPWRETCSCILCLKGPNTQNRHYKPLEHYALQLRFIRPFAYLTYLNDELVPREVSTIAPVRQFSHGYGAPRDMNGRQTNHSYSSLPSFDLGKQSLRLCSDLLLNISVVRNVQACTMTDSMTLAYTIVD